MLIVRFTEVKRGLTGYEKTIVALQKMLAVPFPRSSPGSYDELTLALRDVFRIGTLLTVLRHLRMEIGYELDYVYAGQPGFDGFPILYASSADTGVLTTSEQVKALPEGSRQFPLRVETDGSEEGFFELELLRILGSQFFLGWHANYKNVRPVCGDATLRAVSEIVPMREIVPDGVLDEVRRMNLDPTLRIYDETAVVGLIVFSPWGGFNYQETTFRLHSPHSVLREQAMRVAEYDCGVIF